jgi:hypothetical protein
MNNMVTGEDRSIDIPDSNLVSFLLPSSNVKKVADYVAGAMNLMADVNN